MYLLPSGTMTTDITISSVRVRKASYWNFRFPTAITSAEYNHFIFAELVQEAVYPQFFDPRKIICLSLYYDDADEDTITIRNLEVTGHPDERRYRPLAVPKPQKVTALAKYSGDASGIERPWVLTDQSIWELDDNDNWNEIPLGELKQFSDGRNGQAWCQNDVYLYFSLGENVERYYNRNMDDIGPNRLSTPHPGDAIQLISYPGRVYGVFDGGTSSFSSIKLYRHSGWHEVYTALPVSHTTETLVTRRIKAAFIQPLPGKTYSKLWIQEGRGELFWVYLYNNPYHNETLSAQPASVLVTGKIRTNLVDLFKVFKSLKVVQNPKYTGTSRYNTRVLYRTSEDAGAWTEVVDYYDEASEEINLAASYVRAKWVQLAIFMFKVYTGDFLEALLLEYYTAVAGKYAYSFGTYFSELSQVTLNEQPCLVGNYNAQMETVIAKLKDWANTGTVLTQNCTYSPYHNKKVVLSYPGSAPIRNDSENQKEDFYLDMTTQEL